jgi:hypothetical protein
MATTPKLISTKKVRTCSNKDNTKAIKLSQTTKDTGSKACVSFAYGYKALASDWSFSWTKLQGPNTASENEQAVTCMEVAWLDHDNYLIIGTHTSLLYCGTTHVLTLPTFIVEKGYEYTANTLNPAESTLITYTHNTAAEDDTVITQERYKFVALYECEKGFDPEENNFYRSYHFDKPPEPDWPSAAAALE